MDIPSRRTPDGPVVAHDDDDASSHAELPLVRRERTEGKEVQIALVIEGVREQLGLREKLFTSLFPICRGEKKRRFLFLKRCAVSAVTPIRSLYHLKPHPPRGP